MAAPPTIPQTIIRGKISAYLAGNANSIGFLYGIKKASPLSMATITMLTDALEWGYNGGAQTNSKLVNTANYLFWLCGIYGQEAEVISGGAGGGTVIPGGGSVGSSANPIDWVVSGTASGTAPLSTGQTTVTLDGSGGMPDLRGFNVDYFRGGIPQYTTSAGDGSNYYNWSSATGTFTLLGTTPEAQLGEQMRISPYR